MIVYIAGPMSGYPDHNFPAFHAAAAAWRLAGHQVISPAELDDPTKSHEELAKVPWDWYLRRDLAELVKAEAIVVLEGWEGSRGASLEVSTARGLGMPVYYSHGPNHPIQVPATRLIRGLDEYQANALKTAAMDLPPNVHRMVMALGVAGEAGEVADLVKKEMGHGHVPDERAIAAELGDLLWYVAMLADAYGLTLGDVARFNAQKLALRYPEGFTPERSRNRDAENEAKARIAREEFYAAERDPADGLPA